MFMQQIMAMLCCYWQSQCSIILGSVLGFPLPKKVPGGLNSGRLPPFQYELQHQGYIYPILYSSIPIPSYSYSCWRPSTRCQNQGTTNDHGKQVIGVWVILGHTCWRVHNLIGLAHLELTGRNHGHHLKTYYRTNLLVSHMNIFAFGLSAVACMQGALVLNIMHMLQQRKFLKTGRCCSI